MCDKGDGRSKCEGWDMSSQDGKCQIYSEEGPSEGSTRPYSLRGPSKGVQETV